MTTNKNEKTISYIYLHLLYFLYSWVLITIKFASQSATFSSKYLIFMFAAVCLLGVYAVFWQKVIKKIDLTLAYPQKGAVIFWVMLWSWMIWGTKITVFNILGACIIIMGIALLVNEHE